MAKVVEYKCIYAKKNAEFMSIHAKNYWNKTFTPIFCRWLLWLPQTQFNINGTSTVHQMPLENFFCYIYIRNGRPIAFNVFSLLKTIVHVILFILVWIIFVFFWVMYMYIKKCSYNPGYLKFCFTDKR